uniref:Uncharacterized protein LOC113792412 n=1 Tax=Dermatophagoides pteronyssinus TaxID=6956 RepID=A0A6P6XYZ7_DERPT|nr:uncharacterized protein LOC113792412 [Dermatophagoides pteronyssinus]
MKVMMPEFESRRTTKQTLLQHQSIDDLFGGALASTLKLRSLIYKIWTMKYDWNDELEESLRNKRILDDHELSKFVSANQDAIDAVCYLSNQNQISFTYAESKLIKPTKIVSGELLVFTVGENISQTVLEILHLKRTMVRSDSMDNVKRLEDDINKSYRLKLTEIVNEQPISIMMQVTKNGSKEKGFDIARWDLTTKRSYQSWEELVQKQSDEWKKSIYDNNDELTILIKLHQQQFIDEQFEKTKLWFHDESGLAWCLTRLERMELEYNEKYPIVWPTCEHNKAFVRCLHQNDEHGSVTYSLSNLSLKHFVLGAQQLLITIKKRCAKYRQISSKPLKVFTRFYEILVKAMTSRLRNIVWQTEQKTRNMLLASYRVQSMMNSRPRMQTELHRLTMNHLVYGNNQRFLLISPWKDIADYLLVKYWQRTERMINGAYRDVHLKKLQLYRKNNKHYEYVNVGDQVLLVNDNTPIGSWRAGRVMERISNKDDVYRTDKIQVDGRVVERPVRKIELLEEEGKNVADTTNMTNQTGIDIYRTFDYRQLMCDDYKKQSR